MPAAVLLPQPHVFLSEAAIKGIVNEGERAIMGWEDWEYGRRVHGYIRRSKIRQLSRYHASTNATFKFTRAATRLS